VQLEYWHNMDIISCARLSWWGQQRVFSCSVSHIPTCSCRGA